METIGKEILKTIYSFVKSRKGEQVTGSKYYKRVETGNPKSPYHYYYTKEAYDVDHPTEYLGVINSFKTLFDKGKSIFTKKNVIAKDIEERVTKDFSDSRIDKAGETQETFKEHWLYYFKNKIKLDDYFAKKGTTTTPTGTEVKPNPEVTTEKAITKTEVKQGVTNTADKPTEKKKLNINLLRSIHNLYTGVKESEKVNGWGNDELKFNNTKEIQAYKEYFNLKSPMSLTKLKDDNGNEYTWTNKTEWENSSNDKYIPIIFKKDKEKEVEPKNLKQKITDIENSIPSVSANPKKKTYTDNEIPLDPNALSNSMMGNDNAKKAFPELPVDYNISQTPHDSIKYITPKNGEVFSRQDIAKLNIYAAQNGLGISIPEGRVTEIGLNTKDETRFNLASEVTMQQPLASVLSNDNAAKGIKHDTKVVSKNPQTTMKALASGTFMALAKNSEVKTIKDLSFDSTMIAVGTVNDLNSLKKYAKENGMDNDDYTIYQVAPHLDKNNSNPAYEFASYTGKPNISKEEKQISKAVDQITNDHVQDMLFQITGKRVMVKAKLIKLIAFHKAINNINRMLSKTW